MIAFREGAGAKPATLNLLKDARAANEHVPAILAGTLPPFVNRSGYITMGGPDEVAEYVLEFGQVWKDTPGAVAWLIDSAATAPPRRPRRRG